MSNDKQERGERVRLGQVKRLTTKAGNDWFVGNQTSTTKLVVLPLRRQDDAGNWETVPDQFEVFIQAKTSDDIKKDREYWASRNGGGQGASRSSEDGALKKQNGDGGSSRSYQRDPNDEIPF